MSRPWKYHPPEELEHLVAAAADDLLSEEDGERLARILKEDGKARRWYLKHQSLHANLQWEYAEGEESPVGNLSGSSRRGILPWIVAVASTLAFVSGALLLWETSDSPLEAPLGKARVILSSMEGAQWRGGSLRAGDPLPAGPVSLQAGTASLLIGEDLEIHLLSPVSFQMEEARLLLLSFGSVEVLAHNESGFTVRTESCDFVDLGTRFGVTVEADGASELHVFEGVVVARPRSSNLVVPVLRGEAGRVEPERGDIVAIDLDRDRFPSGSDSLQQQEVPGPVLPRIEEPARIVFLGDRHTDRENHILLMNQALKDAGRAEGIQFFNLGYSFPFGFDEEEWERELAPLRPTHAIIEFGTEISRADDGRSVDRFSVDLSRLLERLEQDGIVPIIATGFPLLGEKHAQARERLAGYNEEIRRLAAERGYRVSDLEKRFQESGEPLDALISDKGYIPTFTGFREVAETHLEAIGHGDIPVPDHLRLELLPGVIAEWQYRFRPKRQWLDDSTVQELDFADPSWETMEIPQPTDSMQMRLANRSESATYRDRARGFVTGLWGDKDMDLMATTTLDSTEAKEVFFSTGAMLFTVWLNGEKVYDKHNYTGWHAGKERFPVLLRTGENRIVIEAQSSFFLGVTERIDWALP